MFKADIQAVCDAENVGMLRKDPALSIFFLCVVLGGFFVTDYY